MVLIKVHTLVIPMGSHGLRKPWDPIGIIRPSSGLQQMVLIKVHTLVIPMGSHGLHWFVTCA